MTMNISTQVPAVLKERLKASYDAMAPEYNSWTDKDSPLRLRYMDKLINFTPKLASFAVASSIVDLGCGSGYPFLTTLLSRHPHLTVTANDMSTTQLDLARKNLRKDRSHVTFSAADMTKLEFASGSQTAVVALFSLIHLPQEEQSVMIERIAGWLEGGGSLLATFTVDNMGGTIMDNWLHEKGWMFWSGLGEEHTLQKLRSVGLEVIDANIEEGFSKERFLWVIAKKPVAVHDM